MLCEVGQKLNGDAQLQVVKAFTKLRDLVMSGCKPKCKSGLDKYELWRCYVTISVRRFNLYLNALKMKFPKSDQFAELIKFVRKYLPPIDILMVWYYFLEIPNAFHATFFVHDFLSFTRCYIPLIRIASFIDSNSMFNVDSESIDEVTKLINGYMSAFGDKELFEYDPYVPFDSGISVPVFCIQCWQKLGMHPLTTEQSDGFVEEKFTMKSGHSCGCFKDSVITKGRLRGGLMEEDMQKPDSFYVKIKYFDYYLGPDIVVEDLLFQIVPRNWSTHDLQKSTCRAFPLGNRSLTVQTYNDVNPISSTIPTKSTIYIREDLVALIVNRGDFEDKMVCFDWYHRQSAYS